jgi:hypothetical protein
VKTLTTILACFLITVTAFGQADTLHLPDSVKEKFSRIDSVRISFNSEIQQINLEYQSTINAIDGQQISIQQKIDSLEQRALPADKLRSKADSLSNIRIKELDKVNEKVASAKSKALGAIGKIELTPGMEGPVGELTQNIQGFDIIQRSGLEIPKIDLAGFDISKLNIAELDLPTGELGELKENIAQFDNIETPLGDASAISGKVSGVTEDVSNIADVNLADVKELPNAVEQQAMQIEGVQHLQEQSAIADQYTGQLADPEAIKKQAADLVKKEAINHFAGQEERLNTAMNKISKYKQRYSSVKSFRELPKRPPNAMKGKQFIERLVPGIYFQYQRKNQYLGDINPYAGYRISGRFTAGLGWNHRFAYDHDDKNWVARAVIFGPRVFVDTKLGRGFVMHIEQETMNTFIPATIHGNADDGHREWVWSTMAGMKREYRIYKNLMGTVLLQYNLFNQYFKTPYVERLNSRIGFEYRLKANSRNKTSPSSIPEKQT